MISLNSADYMWMQTGSNQELVFADDEWIVLPVDLIARALSNICRFTGHASRYYSVAEHSLHISYLVPQELALAALLHDASEAYVGDMSTALKRFMGISFKDVELKATKAVARGYGIPLADLQSPVIKSFDKRILGDEAKLLMPPHAFWDAYEKDHAPTGVDLQCWQPDEANRRFLARFAELGGAQLLAA